MADPTSILSEYLQAATKRDFDKCRELFHPQYSYTGGDGQRQEGAEAGIAVADMFTTAFPDVHIDIKRTYVSGDIIVGEFVATGTHKADLMDIPPTGRAITMPVCIILEIKDGKIFAEREYMDMAHLMQQLGVMEAAATA